MTEWFDASKARPAKSFDQLYVFIDRGLGVQYYELVSYSRKHDRFNCWDSFSAEKVKEQEDDFSDVKYWAIPDCPAEAHDDRP